MNTAIRETHCIDYIGRLELPNVTKVAEHMGMTRGAISKMTKKLLAKGLIENIRWRRTKGSIFQAHGSGQAFV